VSSLDLSSRVSQTLLALGERLTAWVATSGLRIVLILALSIGAARVLKALCARLRAILAGGEEETERSKRAETVAGIVRTAGGIVILVGATMMILNEIGVQIGPLVAAAGIGGLAFGFGAQTLVKDVITGFFLLIEDEIRVGDVIEIAGKEGVVERISLRTIRVRDIEGTAHIVPNSNVTIVSNRTLGFSRYVMDIPLAEASDVKTALDVLQRVGEEIRQDPKISAELLEPLEILGLESPAKAPLIRARVTTRPRRQWQVGRELNLIVRSRFAEAGIDLR
jgi:moderate conductance mechanosensitive channel